MKKSTFRFVFIGFIFLFSCQGKQSIKLTSGGKSDYKIVIPNQASDVENRAAAELQKYLLKISGVNFQIADDLSEPAEKEILVGRCNRSEIQNLTTVLDTLDEDGFLIKTAGSKLLIAGGDDKGTLYGVYHFLENYLGCRMYSSKVQVIPGNPSIRITGIDDIKEPAFAYRELHFPDPRTDSLYLDWHKLDLKKGKNEWGMFVHTFQTLVPAEKYIKTHPEYFSFLNVQRIPDGQLCLTNPDVFKIVAEGLKERMKEKPEALYWSVSQNDTYKACECEHCRKVYQKYGGYSGAMIDFVNQVAAVFPDKVISTLAYQYTRSAPQNIVPAKNVNVMFCSIECNRSRPISTDPSSASFRKDAEDWGKLTGNIFMWDYVVQFRNLLSPFPNLRVLQPNLQYFKGRGMQMMFQQGSGSLLSEFFELRQYLIARLLWNPDCDINAVMNDFVNGYYGPAGKHILAYINTMHDALEKSGGNLGIYGYPYDGIKTFLTPDLIKTYDSIFILAEDAVKSQPEYLERVKVARLPLEFAVLDISLRNVNEDLTYFKKDGDSWKVREDMMLLLDNFTKASVAAGIQRYWEHGNPPEEYRKTVETYVKSSMQSHLAANKPVQLSNPCSEKYAVGGANALTDGMKGINDYHFNWLGFEGTDMVATIDLGEEKTVSAIETEFFQETYSWIFLPVQVEFAVSIDGKDFRTVKTLKNNVPQEQGGVFIQPFNAGFKPENARFIRITAKNMKTCPPWHNGAGYPSWIFCDEIVVR
jgi:hypothetical protein